jgi:hypothetical protein
MVYREVTRVETKEVLRQWVGGAGCKRVAARVGLDVKTVRRYVHAAQALGLTRASGEAALSDEWLTALLASLRTQAGRPRGDAWECCQAHRDRIKQLLAQGLRLSKLRKLLLRQGVHVPYATLHRFAVAELGFGRTAATVPIADCAPGEELQVDTGWMGYLEPDALAAALSRLDFHRGLLAPPLRVAVPTRDHGQCDPGVRAGLAVLRWHLPCAAAGQHQGDRGEG